ncbi:MAG TPA: hypothetical protein VI564_04700 [Candidatus Nanoarchaeia archaeon]|nr:hypothetical protein [Candidatus Nanoarchaeia archaeon]
MGTEGEESILPDGLRNKDKPLSRVISELKGLSAIEKEELFSQFLLMFHKFSEEKNSGKEISIPVGIFGSSLSSLEAIVKYLKEVKKLKFSQIAAMINRSDKTIWVTYRNACKKMPSGFGFLPEDILIPVSVFSDRTRSTLENVVSFLKNRDFKNHEIAQMLNLDDRTIWSVYDKVKKKRVNDGR